MEEKTKNKIATIIVFLILFIIGISLIILGIMKGMVIIAALGGVIIACDAFLATIAMDDH